MMQLQLGLPCLLYLLLLLLLLFLLLLLLYLLLLLLLLYLLLLLLLLLLLYLLLLQLLLLLFQRRVVFAFHATGVAHHPQSRGEAHTRGLVSVGPPPVQRAVEPRHQSTTSCVDSCARVCVCVRACVPLCASVCVCGYIPSPCCCMYSV
jgi:hypothetical protein